MKRALDIVLALFGLTVTSVPMLLIALIVKLTSSGPVLYWSDRVGRDNRLFRMPKFRTMRTDAPEVAAHLLADARTWMTPVGNVLRRTSLDELPQLWSILKGDLAVVGPRPALFNQHDLIALRIERRIHGLTPGLTGWAQIHGRNELSVPEKVAFDAWYAENQSLWLDFKIITKTFGKMIHRQDHRTMAAETPSPESLAGQSISAQPAPSQNLHDCRDQSPNPVHGNDHQPVLHFAGHRAEAVR